MLPLLTEIDAKKKSEYRQYFIDYTQILWSGHPASPWQLHNTLKANVSKVHMMYHVWYIQQSLNWTEPKRDLSSQDHGKPPSVWLQVALNFHCFLSLSLSLSFSPGDMLRHVRSPPCLVTALTPVVIPTLSTWMQRRSGRDQWCRKKKRQFYDRPPPPQEPQGTLTTPLRLHSDFGMLDLNDSATLPSKRPR